MHLRLFKTVIDAKIDPKDTKKVTKDQQLEMSFKFNTEKRLK